MSNESIYDKIKHTIGVISFTIYLWSIGKTDNQFWEEVYSEMKIIKGDTISPQLRVTRHIKIKESNND